MTSSSAAGVKRFAFQSLLIVAALSVLLGVAGAFGANFLIRDVVGAKGQVAELAVPYLRAMLGGSFTIFFLMHLTVFRSLQVMMPTVGQHKPQ